MLETVLLVLGLTFGVGNRSEGDTEYQFYRGVAIGCVGGTIVISRENFVEVPIDQAVSFCESMTLQAWEGNLYGEQR